jgi:hypothetical protein
MPPTHTNSAETTGVLQVLLGEQKHIDAKHDSRSGSGEPLYPHQVAVVLGRGKLHEDRGGPNEVGGIHR